MDRSLHSCRRHSGKKFNNKTYYQRDPEKANMHPMAYFSSNVFAGKPQPQFSSLVDGKPPEGMEKIKQRTLSQAMRHQSSPGMFF